MPKTKFRPQTDGFAFDNHHWEFDQEETAAALGAVQNTAAIAMGALAPFLTPELGVWDFVGSFVGIPPGTLEAAGLTAAVATMTGSLDGLIKSEFLTDYGLCGGMAFASLDYFLGGLIIQRGFPGVKPERSSREGTVLRNYLWRRMIDSLEAGVLATTLEWMAILSIIPSSIGGGGGALLQRSREEWKALKHHIDMSEPWPIVLIGTTSNPLHNHQVLATGYDDHDDGIGMIYVYDSNCPDTESTISLNFQSDELVAEESCFSDSRGPLKGFFCAPYQQRNPPLAVGLSQGISVDSSGPVALGQTLTFSFGARNVGFGPTPPLRLSIKGYLPPQPVDGSLVLPPAHPHYTPHSPLRYLPPDGGDQVPPDPEVQNPIEYNPEREIHFTSPEARAVDLAPIESPVAPDGQPSDSVNPQPLQASTLAPTPGPWYFSAEAQLPDIVDSPVYKRIPALDDGTVEWALVVIQAPHRQPPPKPPEQQEPQPQKPPPPRGPVRPPIRRREDP